MQVVIKRVNPLNPVIAQALKKLQKSCLPCDTVYDVAEGWWWIGYYNDMPVAFAGLVKSSQWHGTGYLCRAGVLRVCQGHGVQKKLIKARMQYAKKLDFTHVVTDTRDNPASANSLISCGMKMYDPRSPWAYKESCYWIKKL